VTLYLRVSEPTRLTTGDRALDESGQKSTRIEICKKISTQPKLVMSRVGLWILTHFDSPSHDPPNFLNFLYYIIGLNMFLAPQVLVNFGISPSSKLYTNLVLYLSKCVNLVFLTKFC